MNQRVVVVVPCYNEARRLDAAAFRGFIRRHAEIDFLLVNDGSTDGTADVLETLRSTDPARFSVLTLAVNSGKAEAVRSGLLAAIDAGAAAVAYWDADLATPLDTIPQFLEILASRPELGMVMGSRVQLLGRRIERKLSRHYLGRAFATTVSFVLGLRVYDTQCGAKLFRVTPELRPVFARPFLSRWIFDVEILARLLAGRRTTHLPPLDEYIYELPLLEWRDVRGSKVRSHDFLTAIPEIARIWWTYIRRGGGSAPVPAAPRHPAAKATRE